MAIQMTKWQAQLIDGSKFTGGSGDPYDVNVSAVPIPLLKLFTVSDKVNPSVTCYIYNGKETWYQGGKVFTPTFPLIYLMADQTTLTIDRASETPGDLVLTQE